MIFYQSKRVGFEFVISTSNTKTIVQKYAIKGVSATGTISTTQTPDKYDFEQEDIFTFISTKIVKFDFIIIKNCDYTPSGLCVCLADESKMNVLETDFNFLPISNLENLLFETGTTLSPKQVLSLQKMFSSYSKKWKLPLFQLSEHFVKTNEENYLGI